MTRPHRTRTVPQWERYDDPLPTGRATVCVAGCEGCADERAAVFVLARRSEREQAQRLFPDLRVASPIAPRRERDPLELGALGRVGAEQHADPPARERVTLGDIVIQVRL